MLWLLFNIHIIKTEKNYEKYTGRKEIFGGCKLHWYQKFIKIFILLFGY